MPWTTYTDTSYTTLHLLIHFALATSTDTSYFTLYLLIQAALSYIYGYKLPHTVFTDTSCSWLHLRIHANHGLSEQSSKEKYKPWKWGNNARYYAFHTKTVLRTRKSVPRSSMQSDHTKKQHLEKKHKLSGMDIFIVHSVRPVPSCKANRKGGEDKAEKRRGGKTTSENGQALSSPSPWGQWRAQEYWGNWLWSHLRCPNDPRG